MRVRGVQMFIGLVIGFFASSTFAYGGLVQYGDTIKVANGWFLLDPETDQVQGVSVEKTYSTLLKGKPSRTVIVAVIDSGIDIDHEDLKDIIWVNEKEIPGNGVDDDKNGYVDDVHGWNFIGGSSGNVDADTYELTREYIRLKERFENVEEKKISKKEKSEYAYWKVISEQFVKNKEKNEKEFSACNEQLNMYQTFYENLVLSIDLIRDTYGITEITPATLDTMQSENKRIQMAKYIIGVIFENSTGSEDLDEIVEELDYIITNNSSVCDHYKTAVEFGYNIDYNPRPIVGDNIKDLNERHYGNNDVKGPDPTHGTHVAGIIGAKRDNDLGIKGIADNVRIMPVRAVPDGDERDKDVANAIIYAVDNGAHIINMSFGKDFSPQKEAVDKAVRYAESKGVLLVHAAGNDKKNIDIESNFPTRFYNDGKEARNWIEVGASASGEEDVLVGYFSNYGKKTVDVFAPGVEIFSTTPGNSYENQNGTSMASPVVTGVAALLLSYFPELTPTQVRDIIRQSSRKFDNLKITKPGTQETANFSQLSISGGIVNAYEAVKMAMKITNAKVE